MTQDMTQGKIMPMLVHFTNHDIIHPISKWTLYGRKHIDWHVLWG